MFGIRSIGIDFMWWKRRIDLGVTAPSDAKGFYS